MSLSGFKTPSGTSRYEIFWLCLERQCSAVKQDTSAESVLIIDLVPKRRRFDSFATCFPRSASASIAHHFVPTSPAPLPYNRTCTPFARHLSASRRQGRRTLKFVLGFPLIWPVCTLIRGTYSWQVSMAYMNGVCIITYWTHLMDLSEDPGTAVWCPRMTIASTGDLCHSLWHKLTNWFSNCPECFLNKCRPYGVRTQYQCRGTTSMYCPSL